MVTLDMEIKIPAEDLVHLRCAAKGMISATLSEWPILNEALKAQGVHLHESTRAETLQIICILILRGESKHVDDDHP